MAAAAAALAAWLACSLLLASTASAALAASATSLQCGSEAKPSPEPHGWILGWPAAARLVGSASPAAAVPLWPLDVDSCPACSAGTAAEPPAAAAAAGADPADASMRMEEIALATLAVAGSATTARPWEVGSLLTLRDAEVDCRMLLLTRMQTLAATAPSQSDCGCCRHCCALRRLR